MKRINLALQGGGAHGAFTWGVLDRLLEEEDVEIAGLTGTSAGALNGAVLKAGLVAGGREGAREKLTWLWQQIGAVEDTRFGSWMGLMPPEQVSQALEYSWPFMIGDAVSRLFSPYTMGPFYRNPLEPILSELDFDNVCAAKGPALFICATNVRSGKIRVFEGPEISAKAIMASACLPSLFQAVEIEDPQTGREEAYWDGGYTGNPALFPLFNKDLPDDVVIVNINPLEREALPVTPQQIQNRINEISFNSSLFRELRAISFVQRLLDDGRLQAGDMSRVLVHMIADDELMNDLSVATKLVALPGILAQLKAAGQAAAHQFLRDYKGALGKESSVDLQAMFG